MLLAGRVTFLSSQCLLHEYNIASKENTYGQAMDTIIIWYINSCNQNEVIVAHWDQTFKSHKNQ